MPRNKHGDSAEKIIAQKRIAECRPRPEPAKKKPAAQASHAAKRGRPAGSLGRRNKAAAVTTMHWRNPKTELPQEGETVFVTELLAATGTPAKPVAVYGQRKRTFHSGRFLGGQKQVLAWARLTLPPWCPENTQRGNTEIASLLRETKPKDHRSIADIEARYSAEYIL